MVAKLELGPSCFGVVLPKREKGVVEVAVVVVVVSNGRVGVVVVDVVAIMPVVMVKEEEC